MLPSLVPSDICSLQFAALMIAALMSILTDMRHGIIICSQCIISSFAILSHMFEIFLSCSPSINQTQVKAIYQKLHQTPWL